MHTVTIALLVSVVACVSEESVRLPERVVNGEEAWEGQFPFIASLQKLRNNRWEKCEE